MLHVDASDSGWGIKSAIMQKSGFWTKEERERSINIRKLNTILFVLQLRGEGIRDSFIKLHSDSITALKYVEKSGGTSSALLQELAAQIQEVANKYNLTVE